MQAHTPDVSLFLLATLFASLTLAAPAHADCGWALLLKDGGYTTSGGSVTWSAAKAPVFLQLLNPGTGPVGMTSISSSNPGVVSVSPSAGDAYAYPHAPGTATLTATTNSAECGTMTLDITLKATQPPTAYGSGANPITLDITGGGPTAVAIGTVASHGIALASGTSITYQPDAGFAGSDSFTYIASNSLGAGDGEHHREPAHIEPVAGQFAGSNGGEPLPPDTDGQWRYGAVQLCGEFGQFAVGIDP